MIELRNASKSFGKVSAVRDFYPKVADRTYQSSDNKG